jgi:HAD superfamily hydrolase (TIGR01509 family)
MQKAFIFDMDGVIINSEPIWKEYEKKFLPKLFGQTLFKKLQSIMRGRSINAVYEEALKLGLKLKKEVYDWEYEKTSKLVYNQAKLTPGIEDLIDELDNKGFKIAIVSSSNQSWIDLVLNRLSNQTKISYTVSVNDREYLKGKPAPDGYLDAMQKLKVTPQNTTILEDSQTGIDAAKASGAFTICLKTNLPEGYHPKGADLYVDGLGELLERSIIRFK